jgi:hypothetical protein
MNTSHTVLSEHNVVLKRCHRYFATDNAGCRNKDNTLIKKNFTELQKPMMEM